MSTMASWLILTVSEETEITVHTVRERLLTEYLTLY